MMTHLALVGNSLTCYPLKRPIRLCTQDISGDKLLSIASNSLSDVAYERLKHAIVCLDLAPGSVVREEELIERSGIGRTPVREALQRLQRDQLVTVLPRQGVMVTNIDVAELPVLFETRTILEPYVHRLAAVRGTAADWDAMDAALAQVESQGASALWTDLLEVDRFCHEQVYKAGANRFLFETLNMLYTQSERLWYMYLKDGADLHESLVEHRAILSALRDGDGDKAATMIDEHIRSFEAQTRAVLYDRLRSPLAGY
jgi:DNA-binding GntR family transcriptional regulator